MASSTTEKFGSYYKFISVLADLALLNFCGYLVSLFLNSAEMMRISVLQILLVNFLWFNVTQVSLLYKDLFAKDAIPTIKQTLFSLLLFAALLSGLIFYVPEFTLSSELIFYTFTIFFPILLVGKIFFLLLRRSHRAKLIDYTRVVIVGAGTVGQELKKMMESETSLGYRIVGFFDDRITGSDSIQILGNVEECVDYVCNHQIREIYCTLPDYAHEKITRLMRQADKQLVRFKIVPDVKNYFRKNVNVSMLGHFPVFSPRAEPLENYISALFKRMFDVVFSLLVIIFILSWLAPVIALLIKMESRGPIFFRQLRSGKDNKPFYCLKFRSMYVNNEADCRQTTKNDSRITKVGAFLRKTSLDELPQFFNVLVGNMSVVGPRPHMLRHTKQYSDLIDEFMVRHFLMPGITGWAQVSGLRGETQEDEAMEARVKADIWYMENWSMFLDLKIIFLTVWQVFAGDESAY